jgi:oxygen-independent coproporphyrinogen-3 oxidase
VTLGNDDRRTRYVDRLLSEVALRPEPEAPFDTLYFGGGTPSSLPDGILRRVVDELSRRGWLAPGVRITLEVNPEDATASRLASFRQAGVSTLSLGVQSLDPDSLRFLGRRHGPDEARESVALARETGFETVSVDLIYGLPGQTEERWERDLGAVLELAPDHLSCYQLTVHERTSFGRLRREGRLTESPPELQAELFRTTHHVLESAGFEGYEVSNFSRSPRHRSRHNEKYWSHVPYLGLGPSAHSFDGRTRSWNERSFFAWEKRILAGEVPLSGSERLEEEDLLLERLMLGLRTRAGVDAGADLLERNRPLVAQGLEEGLFTLEGTRIRPTLSGLAVADGLAARFELPSERWKTPSP